MDRADIINSVKPTEEQKIFQRDYFRILLLEHDIDANGKAIDEASKKKDIIECYRLLKMAFIPYSILYDNLKHLGIYGNKDSELTSLIKQLRVNLEQMNHLRNKMSGHLDGEIIDKAIQWQPTLFSQSTVDDKTILQISYFGLRD